MTAPFWILTHPYKRPPVVVAPKDARYVAAFQSLNDAMAFVPRRGERDLRFNLVCQPTFEQTLSELRRHGFLGVCFEPDDETKETKMSFADLERAR